jgi:hypothetical protein
VTLEENEDENVVPVLLTTVMEDAKDELLLFIEVANPSILVAADELFVETVPCRVNTEEFSDADAL